MRLSIIIPAYNCESTITELLNRIDKLTIKGITKEVIVVDDGSKDETYSILKKRKSIKLFQHKKIREKEPLSEPGLKIVQETFYIFRMLIWNMIRPKFLYWLSPLLKKMHELSSARDA